jgi:uncharacterized protein with GYD domain
MLRVRIATWAFANETPDHERKGAVMAKYLVVASYTADGIKGIMSKGGSARREAVAKMASGLGGKVESFYFGFGEGDAYVTVELPDNISAAAVGLAVSATGLASTKTIVLLSPEEIDEAAKIQVGYKAPGA